MAFSWSSPRFHRLAGAEIHRGKRQSISETRLWNQSSSRRFLPIKECILRIHPIRFLTPQAPRVLFDE